MALEVFYESLTAGIVNYLAANSQTIDSNLSHSLTTIKVFDPVEYHLYGTQFPAISVDLKNHLEEREEIGAGSIARRKVTCEFNIGCHIRNVASYTAVIQEMHKMVSNVEGAIRADDTLSNTFNVVDITAAEFGQVLGERGNFQKNTIITLEGIKYVD